MGEIGPADGRPPPLLLPAAQLPLALGWGLWGFLPQSDWCPVSCRLLIETRSMGSSPWAMATSFAHLETSNSKSSGLVLI